MSYRWPGNIRELENAIERACVTSPENVILPENLPGDLVSADSPRMPVQIDLQIKLPVLLNNMVAQVERQYLYKALREARGNVGKCAELCGLSRRSITAKIAEYQLDKDAFKDG
jgi:DNA-binding NtrC family response regulator